MKTVTPLWQQMVIQTVVYVKVKYLYILKSPVLRRLVSQTYTTPVCVYFSAVLFLYGRHLQAVRQLTGLKLSVHAVLPTGHIRLYHL